MDTVMKMRLFYALLFLLPVLSAQAQVKRSITPMDIASMKMIASATWSPDGNTIAYTVRVQSDPTVENKPARAELHLWNMAAGTSTPFVTRGNVRLVSFRPGQNMITFLNKLDSDKTTSLYQIGLNGGEASVLYKFDNSISSYQWSPDGKTLAFIATKPEEKAKAALPYSPELYEQNLSVQKIYLVEPGVGAAKEIAVDGHFMAFEWSPDGKKLLCSKAPTSLVDDSYMAVSLVIIDIATQQITATIDHPGKKGDMQWSPDGKQVAFIAGSNLNDPTDGSLFVAPATGGKPTILNKDWQGMFEQIVWEDATQIHFMGSMSVEAAFGTIKPDAKAKPTMMSPEKGFNILHFELASNGSKLYIADTYMHPAELFVEMSGSTEKKRITNSNPWLSDIDFAKQEVVRYKAKDGLEIDGILIRPLKEEVGKKYPLITIVHGGPEAHFNNGWLTHYSNPGQTGAAEGYAVFYPNYRGSTGRGIDFTFSSQGDPAGKEFDDVVDGVDYLINTGLVDATKVGVTGGSYGGYATGWFSTRYTDRFAAGVMFVGISDNVSKWGTTDIPNEEYLVHARKWVYEDYDFFLKRSPIYYAGQCKTPLLIMHGKEDPRVHPSQSMELYRHIKSRTTTPVELVFYPGEGHGNANSTARYDYNLRLMGWFDKYLKGSGKS
jgi:dipeptidyl aminopeptidase/acylaminoacyl peptidase